ncbi:MAG: aspartyl/asparaginyl beta-hydroxylase domain-containing protein [Hyphomonadaceae bacterium]
MQPSVNPRKTKSFRSLGPVDISALAAKVRATPEEVWRAEDADKPNKFGALEQAGHIVFRFVSSFEDWRQSYERPLWAEWRGVLEPVMAHAVKQYGYGRGAYPRVMLARMPAGGVIHPHRDMNPAAKWPHKIHVPLETNDKVIFFVDGVGRHMPVGEAVEVNNMGVHAVRNDGASVRTHLIFEYYDLDQPEPDWVNAKEAAPVS